MEKTDKELSERRLSEIVTELLWHLTGVPDGTDSDEEDAYKEAYSLTMDTLTTYHHAKLAQIAEKVKKMNIVHDPINDTVNTHIKTWEQGYNHAVDDVLALLQVNPTKE